MPDAEFVTVSISIDSREAAQNLAGALVEARLAACAQIAAIDSVYRWQDAVETAAEFLITAKTTATALPALEALVVERHPYDVPEIVATPVVWAHARYAGWIREAVGG